jgi:hypothetical protein|tara:strand:- start:198 stop:443 length:246 start_codon:yes stop_codon:yes gene_type:complete
MNRNYLRKHSTSAAIIIFIVIFGIIQCCAPRFLYDEKGSIRPFGLGRRRKTIIPIWLLTIIIAILSYLAIVYYLAIPKFNF